MPENRIPWNTRDDAPWIGAPDGEETEDVCVCVLGSDAHAEVALDAAECRAVGCDCQFFELTHPAVFDPDYDYEERDDA